MESKDVTAPIENQMYTETLPFQLGKGSGFIKRMRDVPAKGKNLIWDTMEFESGMYFGIYENITDSDSIGRFHVRISKTNLRIIDSIFLSESDEDRKISIMWGISDFARAGGYFIDARDQTKFDAYVYGKLKSSAYDFAELYNQKNIFVNYHILRSPSGNCWIKINEDSFDIIEQISGMKICNVKLVFNQGKCKTHITILSPFYFQSDLKARAELHLHDVYPRTMALRIPSIVKFDPSCLL